MRRLRYRDGIQIEVERARGKRRGMRAVDGQSESVPHRRLQWPSANHSETVLAHKQCH